MKYKYLKVSSNIKKLNNFILSESNKLSEIDEDHDAAVQFNELTQFAFKVPNVIFKKFKLYGVVVGETK